MAFIHFSREGVVVQLLIRLWKNIWIGNAIKFELLEKWMIGIFLMVALGVKLLAPLNYFIYHECLSISH